MNFKNYKKISFFYEIWMSLLKLMFNYLHYSITIKLFVIEVLKKLLIFFFQMKKRPEKKIFYSIQTIFEKNFK